MAEMALHKHSLWFHILDVLFNIAIIVVIVVGIRTFLISPFQVEGNSMVDTLEHRQYIIINKLTYLIGTPERGDVVVFRPPNERKKHYVKRVIGVPGDEVILREGAIYLKPAGSEEEVKLPEPYLSTRNQGRTYPHPPNSGDPSPRRYRVPEGHYFLLGDNRQGSLDSRSFTDLEGNPAPFVTEDSIKGRVWFIALPIDSIHALETPDYGF